MGFGFLLNRTVFACRILLNPMYQKNQDFVENHLRNGNKPISDIPLNPHWFMTGSLFKNGILVVIYPMVIQAATKRL